MRSKLLSLLVYCTATSAQNGRVRSHSVPHVVRLLSLVELKTLVLCDELPRRTRCCPAFQKTTSTSALPQFVLDAVDLLRDKVAGAYRSTGNVWQTTPKQCPGS